MFLTPVIYSVAIIPEKWRWLVLLNPMAGIVDAYRSAILGRPFEWGDLVISMGMAAAIFLCGLLYFRKTEKYFADIV
jgi:lipopolysaccharide transport system permease protein